MGYLMHIFSENAYIYKYIYMHNGTGIYYITIPKSHINICICVYMDTFINVYIVIYIYIVTNILTYTYNKTYMQ